MKPKILVFASGTTTGGGSGFEKLVEASHNGVLSAYIVCVVSNYQSGGVRQKADRLDVPFIYFPKPWDAGNYQQVTKETNADFFALSGWLKKVRGLDFSTKFNSKTVFNIHPGPLPRFGGEGMYGHFVHEAVIEAFKRGEITHSEVTMHFVDGVYDHGLTFAKIKVAIDEFDTAETLGKKVNLYEHAHQARITNLVVNGLIRWDGIYKDSLVVLDDYLI